MGLSNNEMQVTWGMANSVSVSAAGTQTSDEFPFTEAAVSAMITLKADNAGTPASGDTVDFYLATTCGDPDGAGDDEYPTDVAHMIFLGRVDTAATGAVAGADCVTAECPVAVGGKIVAKNNAASNGVIVSACINEKVVS